MGIEKGEIKKVMEGVGGYLFHTGVVARHHDTEVCKREVSKGKGEGLCILERACFISGSVLWKQSV